MTRTRTLIAAVVVAVGVLVSASCTEDAENSGKTTTTARDQEAASTTGEAGTTPTTAGASTAATEEIAAFCTAVSEFQTSMQEAQQAVGQDATAEQNQEAQKNFYQSEETVKQLDLIVETAPDEIADDVKVVIDATKDQAAGKKVDVSAASVSSEKVGDWGKVNCPEAAGAGAPSGTDPTGGAAGGGVPTGGVPSGPTPTGP
jgi:hypothetical protein